MVGRVLQQNAERCDRQMFPVWPFSLTQTVPCRHAATTNTHSYSWASSLSALQPARYDCILLSLESETLMSRICFLGIWIRFYKSLKIPLVTLVGESP